MLFKLFFFVLAYICHKRKFVRLPIGTLIISAYLYRGTAHFVETFNWHTN